MRNFFKSIFKLNSLKIGIILTVFIVIVIYYRPMFLEGLEAKAYDLRFQLRGKKPGSREIILVLLDEKTIDKLGRWPFPRIYWAQFFKQMAKYKPRVVALDVVFSEPDQNINIQFLEKLKEYYLTQGLEFHKEKTEELSRLLDQQIKMHRGQKEIEKQLRKLQQELQAMPGPESDPLIEYIGLLEKEADTDQAMASALAELDNDILGWFYFQTAKEAEQTSAQENLERLELLKPYAISAFQYKYKTDALTLISRPGRKKVPPIYGFQANLPMFMKEISGSGYFTSESDFDGVLRSAPLLSAWPIFNEKLKPEDYLFFPSLSLEVLRLYWNQPPMVVVNESGVEAIKIGKTRIPVNESGKLLINYQGGIREFSSYSFYDVLNDFGEQRKNNQFQPEEVFKDKIVLVGPTAVGIYDVWNTPFGTFPGVLSHANIIDNVLHNRVLYRPGWMWAFDILIIAVLGILFSLIYPKIRPLQSAGLLLILVAGYWWFNFYLFSHFYYSLTLLYPTLSLVIIYIGITLYHYTMEEREKRFIRNAFSLYLSQEVIDELCKNPEKLKLGGERKRITIFFSDLAGFTSMSERMPPEELVHLLNQYLTEMSEIILKNKGTIDKFEGDAIMAFWGAPMDDPHHALHACESALLMQKKLKELNQKWTSQNLPELSCRIGLNTGTVLVGNMGSVRRMDYTVIGDEVNLASRLEGANKAYGTRLMISESTYQEVKDWMEARELDLLVVVGKQKPVRVFELLGKKGELEEKRMELLLLYTQGMELYRNRKFDQALSAFEQCLQLEPEDSPSKVYLERCKNYLENPPPPDWDGVFRLTKK